MQTFQNGAFGFLIRQKMVILISILACAVLSMFQFKYATKKYKVATTISIQTQYFQIPLVRDFMPETYDGSELRSQRESLIKQGMNHEFITSIGKKYGLFPRRTADDVGSYEIDELAKKFEVVPLGGSSFLISFFHSDPEVGYKVVQDLLTHLRRNLTDARRAKLAKIHDAIQDQLESLAFGKSGGASAKIMAARPDLVREEYDQLQDELKTLRASYSDQHPKVAALTKRVQNLAKWLQSNTAEIPVTGAMTRTKSFSGANVDPSSKVLFESLLQKYHFLEVVISLDEQSSDTYLTLLDEPFIPRSPMWPKRPLFLIWGIATGFLVGSLLALGLEVIEKKRLKQGYLRTA
ncbi:MAG: hypothetical protein H7222_02375 [Methylotenera sp.]|nr:hypothetical protein [Oligoflexia bacterium]